MITICEESFFENYLNDYDRKRKDKAEDCAHLWSNGMQKNAEDMKMSAEDCELE